jgi:hypothetical protein
MMARYISFLVLSCWAPSSGAPLDLISNHRGLILPTFACGSSSGRLVNSSLRERPLTHAFERETLPYLLIGLYSPRISLFFTGTASVKDLMRRSPP